MLAKKEKLEKEKTILLSNLRTESKELQEKKEELQTDLVLLKKAVDETKSEVSDELRSNYFTEFPIF